MPKNYWLLKSEPTTYSIEDLRHDRQTYWEGVRNYQARNFLRDEIKSGDEILFYHSNAEPSGVAGVAKVVRGGYPDPAAYDKTSKYHDPKSKKESPTWYVVDIEHQQSFKSLIPLETLRRVKGLDQMPLLRKGQRLSVQPVSKKEWQIILKIADRQ